MGKAELVAFFDFFSLFGRNWTPIGPFLTPFLPTTHADAMMHPQARFCRRL
jgi:hypothetical protein